MSIIRYFERDLTATEFAQMSAGIDEYTIEQGNPIQTSEQVSFVVLDSETYIGCAVARVYKHNQIPNGWAYLAELFIESPYRRQGLGAQLLRKLEERISDLGVNKIWTRTAGYEAPSFYKKQGYKVCFEIEEWYFTGHSHFGLRKELIPETPPNVLLAGQCCSPKGIHILEREMTTAEFARMNAGFDEYTLEQGNPVESVTRYSLVAMDGTAFVGSASGLSYNNELSYRKRFILTDVFVDKARRRQGLGTQLLLKMEKLAASLGVKYTITWIAGFQALEFFNKHKYEVFCELENWYPTKHSRFGLRKEL